MRLDDHVLPEPACQQRCGEFLHPGLDQQEGPPVGERQENRLLHQELIGFLIKPHARPWIRGLPGCLEQFIIAVTLPVCVLIDSAGRK